MYLQIAQSTGLAAGMGGGGLVGVVLGSPSALPLQAPADPPVVGQGPSTPHQWWVMEWQQAPPRQRPHALPAVITTLTPDLLTGPEVVKGHCCLLIEVGVGFFFLVGSLDISTTVAVFFHLPSCFAGLQTMCE